jgi:hypothetical protein
VGSDASRFRRGANSLAGSNAALHHEHGRRLPAHWAASSDRRAVETWFARLAASTAPCDPGMKAKSGCSGPNIPVSNMREPSDILLTTTTSVIGCFNAKYKYGYWRPVTAIIAGGGNSALMADTGWLPLGTTPNHPEYPAAHGCVTGVASVLVAAYFGTTRVHVVVDSTAFSDGMHTHTFEDTRDWMDEVFWARIYAGFHYHRSMEDGRELGATIARELLRNHFLRAFPSFETQRASAR